MAFSIDLSGLPLIESEVAVLQAQQAAAPTGFTGGQTFAVTFRLAPGNATQQMSISQLVSRVQAILLNLQQLPQ